MNRGGYKPGDHWVTCDVCGFNYRQSMMRKRWDNLIVCPYDFELRHPQDFVRAVKDDISAKGLVRVEPADSFIGVCTNRSAVAGVAIAGCAIVGTTNNNNAIPTATF